MSAVGLQGAWRYHNGTDTKPYGTDDCTVDVVGTDGCLTEGWWPHNIVWKNVVRWRVHEDHGETVPNILAPDLLGIFALLYASEINCGIESFWDGGFTGFLGDHMNGRSAEEVFYPAEFRLLADWFAGKACELYPASSFAKERASAMSTGTAKTPQAVEGQSPASATAKPGRPMTSFEQLARDSAE